MLLTVDNLKFCRVMLFEGGSRENGWMDMDYFFSGTGAYVLTKESTWSKFKMLILVESPGRVNNAISTAKQKKHNFMMINETSSFRHLSLFTSFVIQRRGFDSLAKDFHRQRLGILQGAVFIIVALENGLSRRQVPANASGLPAAVIATGVALIQLEPVDTVPSGVQEGATERTHTAVLSVTLLHVADSLDQLFTGHWFAVGEGVLLVDTTSVVN